MQKLLIKSIFFTLVYATYYPVLAEANQNPISIAKLECKISESKAFQETISSYGGRRYSEGKSKFSDRPQINLSIREWLHLDPKVSKQKELVITDNLGERIISDFGHSVNVNVGPRRIDFVTRSINFRASRSNDESSWDASLIIRSGLLSSVKKTSADISFYECST